MAVSSDPPADETDKQANTFGEQLRRIRDNRGYSQTELADRMHRSVSLISLLESGSRRVTHQVFAEVSAALKLTTDEETALSRAAGFPVDELERATRQVVGVIAQQMPIDEVDRDLMLADLTATVTGWRDLMQGKARTLKGELEQAHERFEQLVPRTEVTPMLAAYSCASLADISEKLGKLSKAEEFIRKAQLRMQQCEPDWGSALRAEIDAIHAMVAVRRGRYEMADTMVRRGEVQYTKMLTDAGNKSSAYIGLAKSYIRWALLAMLRGEPNDALIRCDTAERHLAHVNQTPGDRRRLRINALRAWAYSKLSSPKDAQRLHAEVRDEYARLGDQYGVAKNWLYLGDDYLQEIEALIDEDREDAGDQRRGGRLEQQRELLRASRYTLDEAERSYREAIKLLEPTGEQILIGRCWRSLGDILRLKAMVVEPERNYAEARQYLNMAWTLESEIGQGRRIPNIYESLARLEWASGSRSSAERYYRAALDALDSPLITATDPAGEMLRRRCERALDELRAEIGIGDKRPLQAPSQAAESGSAPQWRTLCQQLVDRLVKAVAEREIKPVATSDVDTNWLKALRLLEQQDGPRILAQNTLSVALSSSLPAGCRADDAHLHKSRWEALRNNVKTAHAGGGRNGYRDLCCRAAVERGFENDATKLLYQLQVAQAIELLRDYSRGYSLATSIYELPLAFAVKGDTVLVKVPGRLAARFVLPEGQTLPPDLLCYRIEGDRELARDLGAIFDDLVKLAQASIQRQELPSEWLEALERVVTRSVADASAL